MANLRRVDVLYLFALSALPMTPFAAWAQQPIADKMAQTHGLGSTN